MSKFLTTVTGLITSGFGVLKLKKWVGILWTLYRNKNEINQFVDASKELRVQFLEAEKVIRAALKDKNITDAEKDAVLKEAMDVVKAGRKAYDEAEDIYDIIRKLVS